jgi:hypothetical protein
VDTLSSGYFSQAMYETSFMLVAGSADHYRFSQTGSRGSWTTSGARNSLHGPTDLPVHTTWCLHAGQKKIIPPVIDFENGIEAQEVDKVTTHSLQ